ncbi:MAG TPA: cysteine--tRNA ligase [Planctomycetota bacterium]|nr:cysteine--tRNA ligase [Planctomycetota bacterium]
MRLYDTLTRRIKEFAPAEPGHVRMYNCGPTVYRRNHLGNYRAYATADLLRRTFEFLGWRVTQVMNITDVGHLTEDDAADAAGEDKLQKEAQARKVDPWQIAREVEGWFHEDRRTLRILDAHRYPRATEHIPEMIAMIEELVRNGHAYVADGNVYFSVKSFPAYGALSGNTVEQLDAGASGRVEERSDKRSPHDFALWKHDPKHLMQWDSPWGKGFPGWHIECSAMSLKYLGDTFDLHTGGPDNIFPHHECEIAQSESATRKPFVRFWAHCGWLTLGGEKMSKRAGKIHTVPELVEQGYAGADIRLFLLKQHYRAPLPFRLELLDEAKEIRKRFNNFVRQERPPGPPDSQAADAARARFRAALEDDLNTSEALAVLHELMTTVNRTGAGAKEAVAFLREADRVFAILDEPEEAPDAGIERLMAEREAARKSRDFKRADAIRDELLSRGIELLDTPQGTRWRRK